MDVLRVAPAAWIVFSTVKVRASLTGHSLPTNDSDRRSHRTGKRLVGDHEKNPGVAVGNLETVEE